MSVSVATAVSREDTEPGLNKPLQIEDLTKTFHAKKQRGASQGEGVKAIDHVDLEVNDGEMVVLLGPSGCGKTTLLRSVAGLEEPQSGRIAVAGRTVFSDEGARRHTVPTAKRGLSMMFQSYALWPHMTVRQNIGYPLEVHGESRTTIAGRVDAMLELLGLDLSIASRYPSQISGGQQQRVALGRALVLESPLILFDEPLSNVDAKVRDLLRAELVRMQEKLGFAGLYVTHDQREAFGLGHRIAVMSNGRIEQIGSPREVYERPSSLYVARFVGTTNEISGVVTHVQGDQVVIDSDLGAVRGVKGNGIVVGDHAVAVFRPESCELELVTDTVPPTGATVRNEWTGVVSMAAFEGASTISTLAVGSRSLMAATSWTQTTDLKGREARVGVDESNVLVLADGGRK